jgi:lipid II:glycine glycyltransferase (peptidoglycan interpeptide bridge formation enzyme)
MKKYTLKQIQDKKEWDAFVQSQPYTLFVQSPNYGSFFEALGEKSWIFGIYNETDTLVGGSLVLSTHAKRGNFLYLPYGPLIDLQDKQLETAFHEFTIFIRDFAKKNNYRFIRVSPFAESTEQHVQMLASEKYISAPMHVLAETTWLLDVTKEEKELMRSMKKNHRNLIRRCEREGVRVEERTDLEALEILHTLLDETEKRHKFTRFSRSYINREFTQFAKDTQASIFIAYLPDGTVDSAAIIMFYGNMAVYRHSGSLNKNKKLPTSYLIQWRVIQEAKKRGITWYNFWGIAPENAPATHPFKGITHFKKGFGGKEREIVHCQDLVISWPYYAINWIIESIRSIRRGFA